MSGVSPSMEFLVELVDVQVSARGSDATVNIVEATLTLKGPVFTAVCHYYDNGNRILQTDKGDLATWLYPDSLGTDFPEGMEIVCILYKKSYTSGIPSCYATVTTNRRCTILPRYLSTSVW
jgi:hypothetical protein